MNPYLSPIKGDDGSPHCIICQCQMTTKRADTKICSARCRKALSRITETIALTLQLPVSTFNQLSVLAIANGVNTKTLTQTLIYKHIKGTTNDSG